MTKRYMGILYGIIVVFIFIVSMQLFSSSTTCFQYNVECGWNTCNSKCAQFYYGATCRHPYLIGAYCGEGHICLNIIKGVCDNNRSFYYTCEQTDYICPN
jgi:hypothetical protein